MKNQDPSTNHTLPTLEDVAKHADVSTATVSRCLNFPEQVVQKTRDRVMVSIRELGYSPNFGARALAAKRTNTIGAIIPTMENAIFARGIQAFQEELHRHGITLLVSSSSYSAELEEEQIRTLVARGADGLLLIGFHRSDEIYRFLEKQGTPVLVAWVYGGDEKPVSIGFDNEQAMENLAAEALSLGHRNIGIISAEQAANDRARARVSGIYKAMRHAGLDPTSADLVETIYDIDCGAEAFRTLMSRPIRPTVVICGNDVLAAGALQMAKKMGLGVPDDVSITGFDDIELAKVMDPPLTTVHVPHRKMGREAARLLVRMVRENMTGKSVRLTTELCLRGTLGPPPS